MINEVLFIVFIIFLVFGWKILVVCPSQFTYFSVTSILMLIFLYLCFFVESAVLKLCLKNVCSFLLEHLYYGKVWSCCPKNWKSFSSSCYFISSKQRSWKDSQENCSTMEAHLVVINSKEEQDFITWNLNKSHAYFVGLSDPEGQRHWQWIDQTPYNENTTFWHLGEPNRVQERCVVLNYRKQWGWNDIFCAHVQSSICEMMKIYL
uniref:C-type lectin domain-containing protein n=1 Tax=Marmota marmota marmota TaxID=9994 RepID=A0A8C5ZMP1_MARMA